MVKVINKSVCRGVAGRRSGNVKGVVIHNTADNSTAVNHMNRLGGYSDLQLQNGFAHYFIDEDTIVRTEDTYNMAWHTANSDGNANYIGYEVCRSTGNEKNFLQAEQNTFKQVAEDLKYYGLPANRDTVRLHKEFVATACPHRSWELHGRSVNSVKDYFIKEIKKYYDNPKLQPGEEVKPVKPKPVVYQTTPGLYESLANDCFYIDKELNKKSAWTYVKGQRMFIEDIVKVGNYTRAKVRLNNDIRYCTMRDDFWKLVYKTKENKIK